MLDRAARTYRREGLAGLGATGLAYVRRRASDLYWTARGTRTVAVGDATATFAVRSAYENGLVGNLPRMEEPMLAPLVSELRPDDVFYDVGGHMGLYACLAADQIDPDRGAVAAFEPYPPMTRRLRHNAALNGGDVRVVDRALSDSTGTAEFGNPFKDREDWSGTAGLAPDEDAADDTITVETVRGDDLVADTDLPAPTVLKVDVEGAEPLVLDGLRDALGGPVRAVFAELHRPADTRRSASDYGASATGVEATLRDHGFAITELQDRGHDRQILATK